MSYRQGDILIIPTRQTVKGKRIARDQGRLVLAYGEVTGHAHAIHDPAARLYQPADLDDRFLKVLADGGVTLTHEEHAPILLPRGNYIVRRQREYTPEAIRRVAD